MTSPHFNNQRRLAREEMATFERLSPRLREAIRNAPRSIRAKTVWNALVRGVTEERIIETINKVKERE